MQLTILALLSVFLYSLYIRNFKRIKQYERDEGPKSHKSKSGTITMGGIIFMILPLFFLNYDRKTLNIVLTILMYGLLGLVDDLLIIIKHSNKGIPPSLKLLLQVIIAAVSFFMYLSLNLDTTISLFNFTIDLKWSFGLLMLLVLTSSTNAFNLTDGIDGLLSGLSLLISIPFIIICINKNEFNLLYMIICVDICVFVFWCFNYPKAFLFMGDTGSLFLGAFYAMLGIYLDNLLLFIFLASIIIFETISVILQVIYFKKTKGKRLFKMAPFHHHLEAIGFKEVEVDLLFYILEVIIIAIAIFFLI